MNDCPIYKQYECHHYTIPIEWEYIFQNGQLVIKGSTIPAVGKIVTKLRCICGAEARR